MTVTPKRPDHVFRCTWRRRPGGTGNVLSPGASLHDGLACVTTPSAASLVRACWTDTQGHHFLLAEPTREHLKAVGAVAETTASGGWLVTGRDPGFGNLNNQYGWWMLSLEHCALRVRVGRRLFLPLFTAASSDTVHLDWNPRRLPGVLATPAQWRSRQTAEHFFPPANAERRVPPPGCVVIPAGAAARWTSEDADLRPLAETPAQYPERGAYRPEPVELFGRLLRAEVRAYLPSGGQVVRVEVSGGVDSALIAAAVTEEGHRWAAVTKAAPPIFRQAQRDRIAALCLRSRVTPQIVEPDSSGAVDWDGTAVTGGRLPVDSDPFGRLAAAEYNTGPGQLTLTGHGGDELFLPRRDAVARRDARQLRRRTLLDRLGIHQTASAPTPRRLPLLAVPESVNEAISSRAHVMEAFGVLAVAPLASPVLRRMTSLLPRRLVVGKRVAIDWLNRLGYDGDRLSEGTADVLGPYLRTGADGAVSAVRSAAPLFSEFTGWDVAPVCDAIEERITEEDGASLAELEVVLALRRTAGYLNDRGECSPVLGRRQPRKAP